MFTNLKIAIVAIAILLMCSISAYIGWTFKAASVEREMNVKLKEAVEQAKKQTALQYENAIKANEAATPIAQKQQEQRVVYRTITKDVIKYVQQEPKGEDGKPHCVLDAIGLRLDTAAAFPKPHNRTAGSPSSISPAPD